MIQQVVMTHANRFMNFLGFARSFLMRQNVVAQLKNQIVSMLKDFFTVKKKLKMAQYRVNYQKYKLHQMEKLIAENNEHVFLKGNKLNELR